MKTKEFMRILCVVLLLMMSCVPSVFATWSYDITAGERQDDVSFNIAGDSNGQNPNIVSELKWTKLKIHETKLHAKKELNQKSFMVFSLGYGKIYSGHNQDSDYLGDNRTGMFSRSENNAGNGHVVDGSISYGYYLNKQDKNKTALIAGYTVNKQSLVMTDGNQTYSDGVYQTLPLGPFDGLNSTYDACWNGPYIGMMLEHKINDRMNLFTRFEYHLVNFYAEGNWNLNSAWAHPKSFEQKASGEGAVWVTGAEYKMDKDWSVKGKVSFTNYKAEKGILRGFYKNGTTEETRLNEANWNSRVVGFSLVKKF